MTETGTEHPLAELSIDTLHAGIEAAEKEAKNLAALAKSYRGEIARRLDLQIKAAFEADDKQHGTVRFPVGNGYTAKAEISRTVEWDSDKLLALAGEMPWIEANHLFTFKAGMAAKMYDALMPESNLKARIDAARTVAYGTPKVTLEKKDA